jgi:nucleoside-diphosphate-sugar epimerase
LFHNIRGLPCLILRTSRFFPEPDDQKEIRLSYEDTNAKINEFLYRRADIEDVVNAHLLALERVQAIGFGRYIVSATTPFTRDDLRELRTNAAEVVRRRVPCYEDVYARRGWSMFPNIDRVYVNERARRDLGWRPRYDFAHVIDLVHAGEDPRSALARAVGSKGYHAGAFAGGLYPVD